MTKVRAVITRSGHRAEAARADSSLGAGGQFGAPVLREGGPAVLRDKEAADRAGYVNQYGMSRKVGLSHGKKTY